MRQISASPQHLSKNNQVINVLKHIWPLRWCSGFVNITHTNINVLHVWNAGIGLAKLLQPSHHVLPFFATASIGREWDWRSTAIVGCIPGDTCGIRLHLISSQTPSGSEVIKMLSVLREKQIVRTADNRSGLDKHIQDQWSNCYWSAKVSFLTLVERMINNWTTIDKRSRTECPLAVFGHLL